MNNKTAPMTDKTTLSITMITVITLLTLLAAAYYLFGQNTSSTNDQSGHNVGETPINKTLENAKIINEQTYNNANASLKLRFNVPLPRSLSGIHHDATLLIDEKGNLIPNEEIKYLFEFYLSAIGEAPLDQIIIRIQHELNTQLNPPALDQALALLKRYIDYKIELASLEMDSTLLSSSLSNIDRIKHQKSQLSELRERYFEPTEYQPLFEQEERYDDYMLNRLTIVNNDGLSDTDKTTQLESLEASLPQEVKALRKDVSLHANLHDTTTQMKTNGASKEALYQVRARSVGEEAASALAQLDQEREQWEQRIEHFKHQKERITQSGLSAADQTLAINDLIDAQFSGAEKTRVRAVTNQAMN